MRFCGISRTFSTENEIQYENIGQYWDDFASLYGREAIKGLGFNWAEHSIEYVLGTIDHALPFDMEKLREKYPDCVYKEVELPDSGWKAYAGQTEDLSDMYGEIYQEGPLKYEIESFFEDGSCSLEIYR